MGFAIPVRAHVPGNSFFIEKESFTYKTVFSPHIQKEGIRADINVLPDPKKQNRYGQQNRTHQMRSPFIKYHPPPCAISTCNYM